MKQEEFLCTASSTMPSAGSRAESPRPPHPMFDRQAVVARLAALRGWHAVLASLALIGVLTITDLWIDPVIKMNSLLALSMLAIVFVGVLWGRRVAIISTVSGAIFLFCIWFFHLEDFRSPMYGARITLLGLLTIGLLISMLTVAAKEEARLARRREAHTAALYSLTKSLAAESELDRILDAVERHVLETFRRPIVILLPTAEGLTVSLRSTELAFDENDKAAAVWAFENDEEAGRGTGQFSDSELHFRPLKTWQGVVGVLGILANSTQQVLPREQQELLGAFLNQAALAITRADLARKAQCAEILQEADKLQKALLNSVSHDLRTPLVSIIGGLNTVLQDAALLDASTQRGLLLTARNEAVRLNSLIQNLLDMTRLEGGAILARTEPCDVHDVIGAALEQMGEAAHKHPIAVMIEPNLPLVPMDHALIVQVMVNLLDNALKYSPGNVPIEIGAGLDNEWLQVRVASRGREIPKPELESVFDKFFRGTSAAGVLGVGLGLSICKGFVEAHRGRIWAEQQHGETKIVFALPLGSR